MRAGSSVYLLPGLAALSIACQAAGTSPLGTETARARVTGTVTNAAGAALGQVLVTVHLPPDIARLGYVYAPGTTGTDGQFIADVVRSGAPPIALLDTISVYVVAIANGAQYSAGPGGGFPTDSVRVRLQFWPAGQTPAPSAVQLQLAVH